MTTVTVRQTTVIRVCATLADSYVPVLFCFFSPIKIVSAIFKWKKLV